jgi:Tol biopolymer transport system component
MRVSPDGKKIVFLRCLKDVNADCICDGAEYFDKEVVVSDLDGTNEKIVSHNKGGFNDYPSWSPDGTSVLFVHSNKHNKLNTDLIHFDLQSGKSKNLSHTPTIFESDHHLDSSGRVTLLQQDIHEHQLNPINNLYQFFLSSLKQKTQISFAKKNLGSHCCYADPRMSPDLKYLSYAQFTGKAGKEGDWDIILKHNQGEQTPLDLSQNDAMDLWPAWNKNGNKIAWTSWDERKKSYALSIYHLSKKRKKQIVFIGRDKPFKSGNKKIFFGRIHWFDWMHSQADTLIFPATYVSY